MLNVHSFCCMAFQRLRALHFFILLQNRDSKHSATFSSIPIQTLLTAIIRDGVYPCYVSGWTTKMALKWSLT